MATLNKSYCCCDGISKALSPEEEAARRAILEKQRPEMAKLRAKQEEGHKAGDALKTASGKAVAVSDVAAMKANHAKTTRQAAMVHDIHARDAHAKGDHETAAAHEAQSKELHAWADHLEGKAPEKKGSKPKEGEAPQEKVEETKGPGHIALDWRHDAERNHWIGTHPGDPYGARQASYVVKRPDPNLKRSHDKTKPGEPSRDWAAHRREPGEKSHKRLGEPKVIARKNPGDEKAHKFNPHRGIRPDEYPTTETPEQARAQAEHANDEITRRGWSDRPKKTSPYFEGHKPAGVDASGKKTKVDSNLVSGRAVAEGTRAAGGGSGSKQRGHTTVRRYVVPADPKAAIREANQRAEASLPIEERATRRVMSPGGAKKPTAEGKELPQKKAPAVGPHFDPEAGTKDEPGGVVTEAGTGHLKSPGRVWDEKAKVWRHQEPLGSPSERGLEAMKKLDSPKGAAREEQHVAKPTDKKTVKWIKHPNGNHTVETSHGVYQVRHGPAVANVYYKPHGSEEKPARIGSVPKHHDDKPGEVEGHTQNIVGSHHQGVTGTAPSHEVAKSMCTCCHCDSVSKGEEQMTIENFEDIFKSDECVCEECGGIRKGGKGKGAKRLGNEEDPKAGKKVKTGSMVDHPRGGMKGAPVERDATKPANPTTKHREGKGKNMAKAMFPMNGHVVLATYDGLGDTSLSKSIEENLKPGAGTDGGLYVPPARNLAMEKESIQKAEMSSDEGESSEDESSSAPADDKDDSASESDDGASSES